MPMIRNIEDGAKTKPRQSKEHAFPMWNPLHKYFKGNSPFFGYVLAGYKYLESQDEFEYTGR